MQELLFKSILNPLPASETANSQRLLMYRNRNKKIGDDNQKSGDDKFERRPRRAPPPNPDVASLTTRWESRAQKDSFIFLPCSSDSCSAYRIGSCRNQKMRLKMTELQISTKVKIKLQIYKKMKIELQIYKEI
jgi:hypothetical protein